MKTRLITSITILALAALMLSMPVMAERQHGNRNALQGPPSAEEQLVKMSEALNLSDDQAVQLLEVLQASRADRGAIHDRVMEQYGPEICAQKRNTEADILAILTPEQAEAFLLRKEEHGDKSKNRRGKGELDCSQYDG